MREPQDYKDNFFEYHLQGALSSAQVIIPIVMEYVNPVSVIDIGCGIGAWLSVWIKNGISNIVGVDGEYVDKAKLLIDESKFISLNLENKINIDKKYDLVTCLEVAEHLHANSAEQFIQSLCSLGDIILFSAAIPGQGGTMHVNEQYPEYWVSLFNKNKFVPVDCVRIRIWEDKRIQWWYRQNIMFFVKEEKIGNYPEILKRYDAGAKVPSLVHPELYKEKVDIAAYDEMILRSPFQAIKYGIGNIFKKK